MEKMTTHDKKLGTEPVGKLLLSLSVPAILGQLVSLLYNMVDRMFIGNMPGDGSLALTGLGVATPIVMLLTAFSNFVGMGGAPRAAIAMGAGRDDEAERILGNGFSLLTLMGLVLTLLMQFLNKPLLLLFGASAATLPYALDYMQVYSLGTLFVLYAVGLNPFISTQGFARMSMVTISIGAALNLALDPLFIYAFGLGVKGAALATILSQAVSAAWVLFFLRGKKTHLNLQRRHLKLRSDIVRPMLALGLSPFIMTGTESILMVVFNTSLHRFGGDLAVGAMTIMGSAMQFAFLPLAGLSQGAQPIISYNYGARKPTRMKRAFRYLLTISLTYTTVYFLFIFLFPHVFARIFTPDANLIALTSRGMRIYLLGIIPMAIQTSCQQTFLALGQAKVSIFLALLRKLILLIPLIYILPSFFTDKVWAVWLAEAVTDIISATVAALCFYKIFNRLIKNINDPILSDTEAEA